MGNTYETYLDHNHGINKECLLDLIIIKTIREQFQIHKTKLCTHKALLFFSEKVFVLGDSCVRGVRVCGLVVWSISGLHATDDVDIDESHSSVILSVRDNIARRGALLKSSSINWTRNQKR